MVHLKIDACCGSQLIIQFNSRQAKLMLFLMLPGTFGKISTKPKSFWHSDSSNKNALELYHHTLQSSSQRRANHMDHSKGVFRPFSVSTGASSFPWFSLSLSSIPPSWWIFVDTSRPTKPSTDNAGNIKPGATTETFTNAVANAGLNPAEMHMPKLNPNEAEVRRIFGGNRSTNQVQNGPIFSC